VLATRGGGPLARDLLQRRRHLRLHRSRSTICLISSSSSGLNSTTSSTRLRNSGRKWWRSSPTAIARLLADAPLASMPSSRWCEPMLEVMMMTVFLKSTVRPCAVGEPAVVEDLQQDVEHVGVRLLDLVEEHHRVGLAPHRLGQLAALLVADVAGGRADQTRHRVLLHVLRHVDADQFSSLSNSVSARVLASSVLPTPVGPRKMNEPIGPRGSLMPGARAQDRVATSCTASSWPITRSVQDLVEPQQLLALALDQLGDRDAGPRETISAISSSVTSSRSSSRLAGPPRALSVAAQLALESRELPWRSSAARFRS
jgi:hypothetical protein